MKRTVIYPQVRMSLAAAMVTVTLGNTSGNAADVLGYSIDDLLAPCVEADNDARWGTAAEDECKQSIAGDTDTFAQLADAEGEEVCLPHQNRPDEARWAFMKWARQNDGRRSEPATDGLKIVLQRTFVCP